MVAIGRWSAIRADAAQRMVADLPAVLLVLTPVALLNALVGIRRGAPNPAEADAVITASLGLPGTFGADVGFLAQLTAAQSVAGTLSELSLLQTARGLCLLAGLLSAALLWPVLRRLDLSGNAAATAVIVAGLGPIALRLQPSVDAGAPAAFWLVLAAAIGFRVRASARRTGAVAAALIMAVGTAPLAAAGLLGLLLHRLAVGRGAAAERIALPVAVAAAVGAVLLLRRPLPGRAERRVVAAAAGPARVGRAGAGAHLGAAARAAAGRHGARGLAGLRDHPRPGPADRPAAGRARARAADRGAARRPGRRSAAPVLARRRDRGDGGAGQQHGDGAVAGPPRCRPAPTPRSRAG